MFNDYMSKLTIYVDTINSSCVTIVGDYNADISKKSDFENIFLDFCRKFTLAICDQDNLPVDTYIHVSSAWGSTSWLDHVSSAWGSTSWLDHVSSAWGSTSWLDHVSSAWGSTSWLDDVSSAWGSTSWLDHVSSAWGSTSWLDHVSSAWGSTSWLDHVSSAWGSTSWLDHVSSAWGSTSWLDHVSSAWGSTSWLDHVSSAWGSTSWLDHVSSAWGSTSWLDDVSSAWGSTSWLDHVSSAWGSTSWLDHVIGTADAKGCITNMSVLYDCIHSDHHPVSFSIDSDVVPECVNSSVNTNEIKQVIHWDTLLPQYIDAYKECTKVERYKINVLPGVKCNDPNLTRFNKICHPSQRPRWQVDKEAIGLSRVQQCSSTYNPPS